MSSNVVLPCAFFISCELYAEDVLAFDETEASRAVGPQACGGKISKKLNQEHFGKGISSLVGKWRSLLFLSSRSRPQGQHTPEKSQKRVENEPKNPKKTWKIVIFDSFSSLFWPRGREAPGTPFQTFFGVFPGKGLLTPVDGQRYPKNELLIRKWAAYQTRKKSTKTNFLGLGSSMQRGGGRKVCALPQKFVFLGFREESGMSREFCQDVPDPWGCSKSLYKKSSCDFFVP